MSHEIRTPMNAIMGMIHLCLGTSLTDGQRNYLGKAHSASESLLALLNDILDLSKVEAGRMDMESITFSLDEVLENLASVQAQKAQDKGLEFLIEIAPNVPGRLVGDPLRFSQVLVNLINNAIKFTDHGEIMPSLQQLGHRDGRIQLEVSVRDTRVGMTAEQTTRLFQAFSQADSSITRKFGGTGLGLSICKRLVTMMGGTIGVTSAPGMGSRFRFDAWFGSCEGSSLRPYPSTVTGLPVIVADGNESARDIISAMLARLSCRVIPVATTTACLDALATASAAEPIRLVILDWNLLEPDGLAGVERIRTLAGLAHQPRLILTVAFGHADVHRHALQAGCDGFLLKPVLPYPLYDTVAALCRGASDRTIAAPDPPSTRLPDLSGLRVLVVEDNEINQEVARGLLMRAGAAVELAASGHEALVLLERNGVTAYDVVLMDIQMPDMDGNETTRRIRERPGFEALPIIGLTALVQAEDIQRLQNAGMNGHVAKPIVPQLLFQVLARHVKLRGDPNPMFEPRHAAGSFGWEVKLPTTLARMGGNLELYQTLLTLFLESHGQSGIEISQLLAQGEREQARRVAHTLRGVAANLGIERVHDMAAWIESALTGAETMDPALPQELQSAVQTAAEAIRNALPGLGSDHPTLTPPPVIAPVSAEALNQILCELRRRAAGNDPTAEDYLQGQQEILSAGLANERFKRLAKQIETYQFSEAVKTIDRFIASKGQEAVR